MQEQPHRVTDICPFDFLLGAVALTARAPNKYHRGWSNVGHILGVMASAGYHSMVRDSQLIGRLLQNLDHMTIELGRRTRPDVRDREVHILGLGSLGSQPSGFGFHLGQGIPVGMAHIHAIAWIDVISRLAPTSASRRNDIGLGPA